MLRVGRSESGMLREWDAQRVNAQSEMLGYKGKIYLLEQVEQVPLQRSQRVRGLGALGP